LSSLTVLEPLRHLPVLTGEQDSSAITSLASTFASWPAMPFSPVPPFRCCRFAGRSCFFAGAAFFAAAAFLTGAAFLVGAALVADAACPTEAARFAEGDFLTDSCCGDEAYNPVDTSETAALIGTVLRRLVLLCVILFEQKWLADTAGRPPAPACPSRRCHISDTRSSHRNICLASIS
jgi:hypothetical protein